MTQNLQAAQWAAGRVQDAQAIANALSALGVADLAQRLPAGSGPGVHSPGSAFAPLPQRTDVLPWSMLS